MGTGVRFRKRVTNRMFALKCKSPARPGRATGPTHRTRQQARRGSRPCFALAASLVISLVVVAAGRAQKPQQVASESRTRPSSHLPARVVEAEHFLTLRGWTPGRRLPARARALRSRSQIAPLLGFGQNPAGSANPAPVATWQPLGPTAVETANFGLVSGRVSSIALDPSDATGNRLYVGTTGGGVWFANNAGTPTTSAIAFAPLTDTVTALGGAAGASISIGALDRAAGRHGRHSGRHRRPQRCARLLLRRRNPALGRRRQLVDPHPLHRRRRGLSGRTELHRRGLCRLCLEHGQSATGGGRRLSGL